MIIMDVTFNTSGSRRFQRQLRRMPVRFAQLFGRAALNATKIIESRLQSTVPVDHDRKREGRPLHQAISSYNRSRRMFGRRIERAAAVVGVWERHAVFVEFGAGKVAPRPFFRQALRASQRQVFDSIVRDMRTGLRTLSR